MSVQKRTILLGGFLSLYCAIIASALPQADLAKVPAVTISKDTTINDLKSGLQHMLKDAMGDGSTAKLNPMAISFVENYIAKNKKGFESMKDWGRPYFNLMDQVLDQHGVPKEMKYLAVIESGLRADALSRTGALGPWNFMPATAQLYGLKVSRYNDERMDYVKSTHAAARMLTDLYSKYGDWLLVIAAYNGGGGNVDRAIRKAKGSRDFWTLQYFLPAESMNHVKKFIGTHYIFEGAGGITTVTKNEMQDLLTKRADQLSEEELNKSSAYTINGRFHSSVILKYTEISKAEFDRYNPNFDNSIALNGKYELRLPKEKMNLFVNNRYKILEESLQVILGE